MPVMIKNTNQNPKNLPKPFIEHLSELRKRLLWCILSLIIGSFIAYPFYSNLLQLILDPLKQTLYYTSPTGGFNLVFTICLLAGALLSLPIWLFHTYRFIEPTLPHKSKLFLIGSLFSSVLLLFCGVSFAYFISLPAALAFLTTFETDQVQSLITSSEYLSFATRYILGFGIIFQLPLILFFINSIHRLTFKKMVKPQRIVILCSFIFAAILTPTPDVINMLLMALPIIVLYYFSIVLVLFTNKLPH